MSSRQRTCKRAAYRGQRWVRQKFWRAMRRAERVATAKAVEPEPVRHRHAEKWDRE